MKKIISILCVVVILAGLVVAIAGCEKREEILKIYVPGQYIDEELFEEFEAWYKEETGKTIRVKLKDFEVVEDIQREVEGARADYDLICPSDYMVEYLIEKNLLLTVDKDIINIEDEGLFKSEYLTVAREYDPTLEYSVPYMYGTLGIVYDYSKTGTHIESWEEYFSSTYNSKKRSIKSSIRDAYAAACLYNARDILNSKSGAEKKAAVQAVFEDFDDDTLTAAVAAYSPILKESIWDNDNVKYEMAQNRTTAQVALMWSCDAGYVMNNYVDDDDVEHNGNRNLWYVVPKEGGNIYMDNFCIPKYAVNVEAANYFLAFLCQKDVAVANSEYAGAISPVAAAYYELYESYSTDTAMYEGTTAGWKEMFIETMFPSAETLNRCGVMKNAGNRDTALNINFGAEIGIA